MGIKDFFKRKEKIIDLSKPKLENKEEKKEESNLGFLRALAASSETIENKKIEDRELTLESREKLKSLLKEIKAKTDNSYNKIYQLADRLDLLEKKLERVERRAGV